jgi:hypothetical protein
MFLFSRAPGSRQSSPTEVDGLAQGNTTGKLSDVVMSQQPSSHHVPPVPAGMTSLSLNVPQFEVMPGYDDPFYAASAVGSNSMLVPPNMDSPNYAPSMDYGQQQQVDSTIFFI